MGTERALGTAWGQPASPQASRHLHPAQPVGRDARLGSWGAVFFGVVVFQELWICNSGFLGCWFLGS